MDRYIAVGTLDYRTYKGDMGLHLLRMDGNGKLKMCHSSYDGLNATYVISGLKNGHAYAVSERLDEVQIAHYRLDEESERLCLCSKMKYGSAGGVHIALSPGGGYVLVPCWKSADVIACALDECGDMKGLSNTLKMPEGAGARMRQTQPNPHQIVFDKSGTYFAVPDLGADRLHIIRWNEEDGSMERVRTNQADPGDGPRHGVFHPVHDWFYLFAELECAVYFYEFHGPDPMSVRRQKIELIPRSFWDTYEGPEIQGAEIKVSADGRFLFASLRGYFTEQGYDRIIRLDIDSGTGTLSNPVSFSSGGHCPRAFEFTPDNRYIVVCNQGDGEVVSLEYNSALGEIGGVCDTVMVQEASSLAFLN